MKNTLLIIFSFFLLISCKTKKPEIKKPSFLIGDWIRINGKEGSTTFETWHKNFTGSGITIKEKDTTFKEILSIINLKDTIFLKVEGVNESPTLFKFTQQTDSSFIAENPKNEFPKKITYWLEKKQLKAEVANPDFKIDFVFEKIKN
ncbi:hypothetical protein OD91_2499 [Lutibacter sp. Hel_I_33_5]|uniref:DUF6265 family protein n=1 Tax=Lutibacter sp. Hel_I_33_5 TaxID=1566289 RepID=UPI0011A84C1D|nr:DUF6265 family protein [Lutibacter sp. Hel_I_33_5]TVZ57189.1 hypothetical protein OD91_2499 [Lutibacter sp. Hel_I_33_5]